jgi:hypothetical protein
MQQHFNRIVLTALFAGGLSGCSGEPEWVTAYEDCKTQMTNISEQMKEQKDSSENQNPHAQAMVDAMSNMAKSMGMAACESFKQICEPNPDGDACKAMVQEYKKSKDKE